MESDQLDNLRDNHMKIIEELEPRDVLDSLFEDDVLTENDMELISSGKTRKERCQILLTILPTRGPTVHKSFRNALSENSYHSLEKALCISTLGKTKQTDRKNSEKSRKVCSGCKPFFTDEPKLPGFLAIFQNHCCLLLENIEPNDIIDKCYQKRIITKDEYDRIQNGLTRKDKCVTMLQLFAKCTKSASIEVFCTALLKKYGFIYSRITETLAQRTIQYLPYDSDSTSERQQHLKIGKESPVESNYQVTSFPFERSTFRKRFKRKIQTTLRSQNKKPTVKRSFSFTNPKQKDGYSQDFRSGSDTQQCDRNKCKISYVLHFPAGSKYLSKKVLVTFDCLSHLVNDGQYEQFERMSTNIRNKYSNNPNILCTLYYLHASQDLLQAKGDAAKKHITMAIHLAAETTNPKYFLLELFTTVTRRYIIMKKYGKLQEALTDAKMILATDKVGCSGRAAGWLYINDARANIAQMSTINIRDERNNGVYKKLHAMAATSFHLALENFERDDSKDGPFGTAFTICRLVILLMRCGDNGLTMDILSPLPEDILFASGYLRKLDDSDIVIPKSLEVHYLLAKCDYHFRQNNFVRAHGYAYSALNLSTDLNMLEFTGHARNRLIYLQTKTPFVDTMDASRRIKEILLQDESSNYDRSRESS